MGISIIIHNTGRHSNKCFKAHHINHDNDENIPKIETINWHTKMSILILENLETFKLIYYHTTIIIIVNSTICSFDTRIFNTYLVNYIGSFVDSINFVTI